MPYSAHRVSASQQGRFGASPSRAQGSTVATQSGHCVRGQRGTEEGCMRATAIDDFGAPPALHDLPVPQPVAGEVLVRVQASSVNGFDLSVAKGYLKDAMEHRFPVVLGKDFAGTVEATGPGVETLQVGDAVFGVVMKPELGDGAFGEYVTAPAAFIAKVPAGLEVARAGALGLAGTAALDAVDAIAPNSGETVLVSGATGGVGAFAVQLLRARGIDVIATASSHGKGAFVRGLGARTLVDYRGELAAVVTAIRPDGPDAALHLAGDGAALATLSAWRPRRFHARAQPRFSRRRR